MKKFACLDIRKINSITQLLLLNPFFIVFSCGFLWRVVFAGICTGRFSCIRVELSGRMRYNTFKYGLLCGVLPEAWQETALRRKRKHKETDMVQVSVIIPVFNGEKYLEKCVKSVMAQTLWSIEIICVDDGSSDNALEILKKLQAKDERIRIVSQPNKGAGAARNNGLRHAGGQYLSFLDADDFFEPDMLERAVEAAEKYNADFVVFNSDQYHMDKDAFVKVPWVLRTKDIPPYMPFTYRQLTDNVFKTFVGWAWDKLYRRDFIMAHDIWFQEQRTTNDMLFVFTALVVAKRIAVVNKVLAHQRRGGSESLSVTREKSWHCFYDALTALRERLKQENIYWELEQDYINYALHFCLWNLNTLAEPTHKLLEEKLQREWFAALGISEKPGEYFYNRDEYSQYVGMMKR